MGPYSDLKQIKRAGAIKRLLDNNPQLDDQTKIMWSRHLKNLSVSEEEYNERVISTYSKMKKGFIPYE